MKGETILAKEFGEYSKPGMSTFCAVYDMITWCVFVAFSSTDVQWEGLEIMRAQQQQQQQQQKFQHQ